MAPLTFLVLALGVFSLSLQAQDELRCPPISEENAASFVISFDYDWQDPREPFVISFGGGETEATLRDSFRAKSRFLNGVAELFPGVDESFGDGEPYRALQSQEARKASLLSSLRNASASKDYFFLGISGHGLVVPVLDSNGKWDGTSKEWALNLPPSPSQSFASIDELNSMSPEERSQSVEHYHQKRNFFLRSSEINRALGSASTLAIVGSCYSGAIVDSTPEELSRCFACSSSGNEPACATYAPGIDQEEMLSLSATIEKAQDHLHQRKFRDYSSAFELMMLIEQERAEDFERDLAYFTKYEPLEEEEKSLLRAANEAWRKGNSMLEKNPLIKSGLLSPQLASNLLRKSKEQGTVRLMDAFENLPETVVGYTGGRRHQLESQSFRFQNRLGRCQKEWEKLSFPSELIRQIFGTPKPVAPEPPISPGTTH